MVYFLVYHIVVTSVVDSDPAGQNDTEKEKKVYGMLSFEG
jgi:hypothetical protein